FSSGVRARRVTPPPGTAPISASAAMACSIQRRSQRREDHSLPRNDGIGRVSGGWSLVATTFDIGRNVRRLRQERGISLSALARDVGFDEVIGREDPAAGKETGGTAAAPAPAGSPPAAPGIGAPTAADAALADATPGTPPGDLTAAFDPGSFPSGLRIFWHEH